MFAIDCDRALKLFEPARHARERLVQLKADPRVRGIDLERVRRERALHQQRTGERKEKRFHNEVVAHAEKAIIGREPATGNC
jgi:hypothetical protein